MDRKDDYLAMGLYMGEGGGIDVLNLSMRWPEARVMGGGRVLELLDSWGRNLWGLSDTFSQPWSKKKTWYLNYALYGLLNASFPSL